MTTDTSRDSLDRLLNELLVRRTRSGDPVRLLADIVRAAESTPQRRGTRGSVLLGAWRGLSMIGAAVVIVAAVIGSFALGTRFEGTGTTPSSVPASPSPAATPSPIPTVGTITATGIDGPPLPAGTWQTAQYEPTLTFTVPDGLWSAGVDIPRQLWLRGHFPGAPSDEFDAVTLLTVQSVYVDPCTRGAEQTEVWDAAAGPAGFLDWLEANMAFDLGNRLPIRLLGGEGLEIEFTAPDMTHCALGFMPIADNGRSSPFGTPPSGQRVRYQVITLGGQTVVVGTWTDDPSRRDAVWAAADAVVASIQIVP